MKGSTLKAVDLDNERFQIIYDAIEEFCPDSEKGNGRDLDQYLNRLRLLDENMVSWSEYFSTMNKIHTHTESLADARGNKSEIKDVLANFIKDLTSYAEYLEKQEKKP